MRTKSELRRLIQGAMGEVKADLIVTGGKLVNVYSGEILDEMEIAVLDGRICYVGPSAAHARGEATKILDAGGLYISPGFIDGHTHIGHYCRPYEYLQAYLPHGTTALMASCDELATVFGYRGLKFFLDEVEAHPLRVFTLISMVAPQDPLLCQTAIITNAEIEAALQDPRILGLGEIVSWLRLTQLDDEILERLEMAWRSGKIIHGHTAGAKDQKLCAVARCWNLLVPRADSCGGRAGKAPLGLLDYAARGLTTTGSRSNSYAAHCTRYRYAAFDSRDRQHVTGRR